MLGVVSIRQNGAERQRDGLRGRIVTDGDVLFDLAMTQQKDGAWHGVLSGEGKRMVFDRGARPKQPTEPVVFDGAHFRRANFSRSVFETLSWHRSRKTTASTLVSTASKAVQ